MPDQNENMKLPGFVLNSDPVKGNAGNISQYVTIHHKFAEEM